MLKFKDLGLNRRVVKTVNFFPTLINSEGNVIGIDFKNETEKALDVTIELMVDYEVPLGILFTKDKKVNVIARYKGEGDMEDVGVFEKNVEDIKENELSELILVSEVEDVMIVEELEDDGIVIISNRCIDVEE